MCCVYMPCVGYMYVLCVRTVCTHILYIYALCSVQQPQVVVQFLACRSPNTEWNIQALIYLLTPFLSISLSPCLDSLSLFLSSISSLLFSLSLSPCLDSLFSHSFSLSLFLSSNSLLFLSLFPRSFSFSLSCGILGIIAPWPC